MSIGILYESHEWSSTALRKYIAQQGIQVQLIDLETEVDVNSVSNFAPENIEMFGFNLIKDTADYIVERYKQIVTSDEQLVISN